MSNFNLKLKGQYRTRVFDKNNQLKTDTDYLDNLITHSGHLFPFDIGFADCFRYLSLGSGTAGDSVTMTGLDNAIPEFEYLGVYKAVETFGATVLGGTYPADWYYVPEGCGTILKTGSVELFRTWRIPTGEGYVERNYTDTNKIYELMTSPSAPIEMEMQGSGLDKYLPFAPVKNYQSLAFSRITIPEGLTLESGDYALISYKLTIYPNTNPVQFLKTFNTLGFKPESSNGFTPCTGWTGSISGIYGLIHPGVKLISDLTGPKPNGYNPPEFESRPSSIPNFSQKFGLSYTPKVGIPLEPSNTEYVAYVSTDNTQFLFSPFGGNVPPDQTGKYYPYNPTGIRSSGVCSYKYELPYSGLETIYSNIRRIDNNQIPFPYHENITSTEVPPVGFQNGILRLTKDAKVSDPLNSTRTVSFTWSAAFGEKRVSSLVLACQSKENEAFYYPFLDMVFNTTDGRVFPETGMDGSRVYYTPTDTGVKLYLDGINTLDLSFNLKWNTL